jgi:hypothetical protein
MVFDGVCLYFFDLTCHYNPDIANHEIPKGPVARLPSLLSALATMEMAKVA